MTNEMVLVKNLILLMGALWLGALLPGAAMTAEKKPVYVFAAASMVDAVTAIIEEYNRTAATKIVASFAGSSVLARQIASGAPVDLFLSANDRWMDYLIDQGIIDGAQTRTLAFNQLVLIAPKNSMKALKIDRNLQLRQLLGDGYLAIGDPDHVPVGIYAKEALGNLGLWDSIAGRTARLPNSRNVLALAERREVPLAIVYLTDALASRKTDIIGRFPLTSQSPVRYQLGLIKQSSVGAIAFYDYLQSGEARSVFRANGFSLAR